VSASEARYAAALRADRATAHALPYVGFQHLAATLQRTLNSSTDTFAFNTACTAAANAVMLATRMIQSGRYAHALVVGFELANVTTLCGFCGLQLVADAVRPFDLRRSGIVLGEGVGAVVLSAATGHESGLYVHAGAANVDTYSVTTANPDGGTIAAVLSTALGYAGVPPAAIRAIKAHGTASPMNDAGEAAGIRRVFADPPPVCALKPYIGHTLGACGVNELVLFGAALGGGFLPATPGFAEPDPALRLSPQRERRAAPAGYYLLNQFGFGGHNTALVVERRD
jgi:3-oxoacyl-[acyl-carrier-protein] synthase-1